MTNQQHRLLLGAHMSTTGGFEKALERGASINCTAVQIFTKSNRQWAAKKITPESAALFKESAAATGIKHIVAHSTYLINIASADSTISTQSVKAVIDELERCQLLGIPYLILHPGSYGQTNETAGLERIVHNLDLIFDRAESSTHLLLENMAGQGTSLCYSFEHIAYILKHARHTKKLGVCFDTCHAFAAGYDFRTAATYQALWQDFDAIIGIGHLKAMHINDSKKELGSRVDRHEDIGKGSLGLEAFRLLFNDPTFFDIPKILETPSDELEDYQRNMAILKDLISVSTRKKLVVE